MAWRPHGHAKVNPRSPSAFGTCDRCYRVFNLRDLVQEMQWRGPRLMWTGFLVDRSCLDIPQQQLRPRILPPDPVPVFNPRPENYSFDDGLQGFTLYTLSPPRAAEQTGAVFQPAYVLAQVEALSGTTAPVGLSLNVGVIVASQDVEVLLGADVTRDYLIIFNPTAAPLALSFGAASFSAPSSIVLNTGQALFWQLSDGQTAQQAAMTITGMKPGQFYYVFATGAEIGAFFVDGIGDFFVDGTGKFVISF